MSLHRNCCCGCPPDCQVDPSVNCAGCGDVTPSRILVTFDTDVLTCAGWTGSLAGLSFTCNHHPYLGLEEYDYGPEYCQWLYEDDSSPFPIDNGSISGLRVWIFRNVLGNFYVYLHTRPTGGDWPEDQTPPLPGTASLGSAFVDVRAVFGNASNNGTPGSCCQRDPIVIDNTYGSCVFIHAVYGGTATLTICP